MHPALAFRVVLHLKEDATEFADPVKLSRLIKQYSQFISFPIKLYSAKKEPRKVTDEEATAKKQEAEDKRAQEKGEEPKKRLLRKVLAGAAHQGKRLHHT
eukprot:1155037-Pelagomonas_calceolata.AAC.6